ncbi:dimethyladenosine transferase 2, mitochondrial [Diorhabda sublineata]|uniref:dimethyladenosine transferase 2, mitochondrial n=1 Tax=Diorhabda sublineata TaxID=1163346 RepID=UPI0024E10F6F|nr:dimethyladenosine transferase 2, mitochondrial [Diorhabda sublineata]
MLKNFQNFLKSSIIRRYSKAIDNFLNQHPHLKQIKKYIPSQYLNISSKISNEYLYLICTKTAKLIADHVIPSISEDQIIAETNAGLGLITTELLERSVKRVRMYESCPDFRVDLKKFDAAFPGRVELFIKNIFHLGRFAYLDKQDGVNRVESLLKNVPKKAWIDDPAMTIVGTLPNTNFIRYLIKSLALQTGLALHGRIQIFGIIKPHDYYVFTATPKENLRKYQYISILFQLLFDLEKLETFPRNIFLPWERSRGKRKEIKELIFVKINFKKQLPVTMDQILPLYYFIKQLYGTGNNLVLPTVEKWVPSSGLNVLVPSQKHEDYNKEINIFTKFRDLTPSQISAIFKEVINNNSYLGSPFTGMIENELVKSESVETSLADATLEKSISRDVEKLNLQDEFD